jgi:hypothetical protein
LSKHTRDVEMFSGHFLQGVVFFILSMLHNLISKCNKVTLVLLRKHTRDVPRSFWHLLHFFYFSQKFNVEYILSNCDKLLQLLLWNHIPYVARFFVPLLQVLCASSDFQWCLYDFSKCCKHLIFLLLSFIISFQITDDFCCKRIYNKNNCSSTTSFNSLWFILKLLMIFVANKLVA